MSDRIFLQGIKFHGYHGLTRMERQVGCRLAVDVTLEMNLEQSGRDDNVRKTLDYRKVHQRVIEVGRGTSHKLLESFAVALTPLPSGPRSSRIFFMVFLDLYSPPAPWQASH